MSSGSDLHRLRSLAALLPPGERAGLVFAVILEVALRLGLVVVAMVAVSEPRPVAVGAGVGLVALAGLRRWLDRALVRRCRAALYDATIGAMLGGPILAVDDESHRESFVAIAQALWVGETFLATNLPGMIGDLSASVLLGAFLVARTPWHVVALGGVAATVVIAVILLGRGITARASSASEVAFRPVLDALMASHQGRLELVAAGRDDAFLAEARSLLRRWRDVAARGELLSAIAGRAPLLAAMSAVGVAVAFDEGFRGALQAVAIRDAVVVSSVVPAFVGLSRYVTEVARASSQLRPLTRVLAAAVPAPATNAGYALPSLPALIEWRDVGFSYEDGEGAAPPVLQQCTVSWPAGKVLLVGGPNGAGKSTLFRLLLGLARPQRGAILVGGSDLSALEVRLWRRAVAYLPQRAYFAEDDDVRRAIRFLAPDADDAAITRALDRVELLPALRKRRDAGDPLTAPVAALSAGQRQRLALARVLCRDAHVVLLDEPDANLDASGIELVVQLVRELARDRMVAVTAHTPELRAVADVVVVLQAGRAVSELPAGGKA